jgi:hypothetical protein
MLQQFELTINNYWLGIDFTILNILFIVMCTPRLDDQLETQEPIKRQMVQNQEYTLDKRWAQFINLNHYGVFIMK